MSDVPLAKMNLQRGQAAGAARPLPFLAPSPCLKSRPPRFLSMISPSFGPSTTLSSPSSSTLAAPVRRQVAATHGLAAMLVGISQVAVQEAPAWALSMVVHMVTLVTMAMVAVPDTVPYRAQHLVVVPPMEQKIEEIKDIADKQPETLDDSLQTESLMLDSKIAQEKVVVRTGRRSASGAGDDGNEPTGAGLDAQKRHHDGGGRPAAARYAERGMSGKVEEVMKEGGTEASEKGVAKALKWLADHQMPDGGWSFDHHALSRVPRPVPQSRQAGRSPQRRHRPGPAAVPRQRADAQGGQEYKSDGQERAATSWSAACRSARRAAALNEPGGNMYSHGIASIVLCEAYAMTHDRGLLPAGPAAINFICYAQDPMGGGWRYAAPRSRATPRWSAGRSWR